jgi:hypothetical protein
MARTITSANSVFTLTSSIIVVPFQVQGFATDDAFDIGDAAPVEVRKGVDGKKSSGYTPYMVSQTVHLQADSPSIDLFEALLAAMDAAQEDFTLDGSIVIPSVGKVYTLVNGSLIRVSKAPPAKKVLEPQIYEIMWDKVFPAPL